MHIEVRTTGSRQRALSEQQQRQCLTRLNVMEESSAVAVRRDFLLVQIFFLVVLVETRVAYRSALIHAPHKMKGLEKVAWLLAVVLIPKYILVVLCKYMYCNLALPSSQQNEAIVTCYTMCSLLLFCTIFLCSPGLFVDTSMTFYSCIFSRCPTHCILGCSQPITYFLMT